MKSVANNSYEQLQENLEKGLNHFYHKGKNFHSDLIIILEEILGTDDIEKGLQDLQNLSCTKKQQEVVDETLNLCLSIIDILKVINSKQFHPFELEKLREKFHLEIEKCSILIKK